MKAEKRRSLTALESQLELIAQLGKSSNGRKSCMSGITGLVSIYLGRPSFKRKTKKRLTHTASNTESIANGREATGCGHGKFATRLRSTPKPDKRSGLIKLTCFTSPVWMRGLGEVC